MNTNWLTPVRSLTRDTEPQNNIKDKKIWLPLFFSAISAPLREARFALFLSFRAVFVKKEIIKFEPCVSKMENQMGAWSLSIIRFYQNLSAFDNA